MRRTGGPPPPPPPPPPAPPPPPSRRRPPPPPLPVRPGGRVLDKGAERLDLGPDLVGAPPVPTLPGGIALCDQHLDAFAELERHLGSHRRPPEEPKPLGEPPQDPPP